MPRSDAAAGGGQGRRPAGRVSPVSCTPARRPNKAGRKLASGDGWGREMKPKALSRSTRRAKQRSMEAKPWGTCATTCICALDAPSDLPSLLLLLLLLLHLHCACVHLHACRMYVWTETVYIHITSKEYCHCQDKYTTHTGLPISASSFFFLPQPHPRLHTGILDPPVI